MGDLLDSLVVSVFIRIKCPRFNLHFDNNLETLEF